MGRIRTQAVLRLMARRSIMFKYDLAQQAGVSYPLLRQCMEEGGPADAATVECLCRFFDCSEEDIVEGDPR